MARQTSSQTLTSIAGWVLAGAGLFILRGIVEEAAQLSQLRGATPGDGLGLWHFVLLAASLNHHQVAQGLLQIIFGFWPLLPVMVGAGLLWNVITHRSQSLHPCDARSGSVPDGPRAVFYLQHPRFPTRNRAHAPTAFGLAPMISSQNMNTSSPNESGVIHRETMCSYWGASNDVRLLAG